MKVADYIVEILAKNYVKKVFGYIGGNNAHIMDSIDNHPKMEMVNTIHEQGAGFSAEGYARATGNLGACTVTSGPGATNLVTPISSCYFDSIPTIYITGQVNTYEYKYDAPVRQIGFQETDIVSIVKPITKYAVLVDKIENIRYEFEKACYLAQEGRKGPVLVDVPIDLQYQEINPEEHGSFFDSEEYKAFEEKNILTIDADIISNITKIINDATRPMILVGGGAKLANIKEELKALLAKNSIPLVYSLMGKGVIGDDYLYNLGFIGAYGARHANLALANCDMLLILGSRLDARQVGRELASFARDAKIIHVDIDKNELGRKVKGDILLHSDLKIFMNNLNIESLNPKIGTWLEKVLVYKKSYVSVKTIENKVKIPNQIVRCISDFLEEDDIVSVDVGLHQMWSAQSLNLKSEQQVLFSGGLGSMGFALSAAIGASIGTGKRVIVISGDGGFQMNIQELEVIKRRNLPIKIFIMNNSVLGMVRQMQTEYLKHNHIGTQDDYSAPDFKKVAEAYGLKGYEISDIQAINGEVKTILKEENASLTNILLDESKYLVEPRLVGNRPMEDMAPFLERDELNSNMMISTYKD